MNTNLTIFFLAWLMAACAPNQQNQPQTGTDWGVIPNPSAEEVRSADILEWTADRGRGPAICFYDHQAYEGKKSFSISSKQPGYGRWYTRVNVKPWSEYQFSGWIKTKKLDTLSGLGAGFHMSAFGRDFETTSEPTFLAGTQDWTEITFSFLTGDQDCLVLECLLNAGGRATGQAWFDQLSLKLKNSESLTPDIRIDLTKETEPMPDYIYGQFIEHLGRCIYGGIWAEMLEDRKFYYAPNERESFWKVSPKGAFEMDKKESFVGEQTPVLLANEKESVRLTQDGIGLRANQTYSGRILLKARNISEVNVYLRNNSENKNLDVVTILNPAADYQEYKLIFDEVEDCDNATLNIEARGNGKLWVGTVSLMPDDNVEGFRADVLTLLKELNSPVYRWPGGNFVSGYDWKDGIGDPDKRPPRKNPAWTGVEHNDVGIHEFMQFCELLGTEAYIAVNAGLGGAEEARKQVEYCNGGNSTPMGQWRKQNGQAEPWKVKWWSVGNEMYGGWQLGHMETEKFVEKHNAFADAMQSVDPDIKLIAVGDLGKWDEMMLTYCADHMDYISEHFYRQDWHGGGLMTHIRQIPEAIQEKAVAHRKYRMEIPGLAKHDIRICMDEWNYWYGPHIYGELGTRYYLRDALGIAAGINEFSRNTDIIYMANYAQTVNVIGAIKATDTDAVMAATGQALKMYRAYFGSIPVEWTGDQRPLDIAAAVTKDHRFLTLSLVNLSWDAWEVQVSFEGSSQFNQVEVVKLKGLSDMAFNTPGQAEQVWISDPLSVDYNGTLSIDPLEARIYRFKLKD